MGPEFSTVANDTAEGLLQLYYIDVVVLENGVESGLPPRHAGLRPLCGNADGMNS